MRKVHLEMGSRTSTAVERAERRDAPRVVLAVLFSLAAFFSAALRPVTLSIVPAGRAIATHEEGDAPVAIDEEACAQCRVTSVRPSRDGRGPVRDFTPCSVDASLPEVQVRIAFDIPSADGTWELAPMRRIRKHAEVMVFLV